MSPHDRIDVHAHFIPPFYRNACLETDNAKPDGMPAIPEWSEESHLELMRDNSITKSILSISSPGTNLVSKDGSVKHSIARECNSFARDLVKRHPQKFGFWAALPLPDVEASLQEIHFALDHLHASGFAMETNHRGVYLGDPSLDPVFDELNKVKATVFIHPTTPCIRNGLQCTAGTVLPQYPNPLMEFMFDTARALINLFASGTVARCPNVTFVVPHAGGALPPVLQRFCTFTTMLLRPEIDLSINAVKETLRRQFFFDLAGFPFPDQIHGILRVVGPERLLYGSDYPFTPSQAVAALVKLMSTGLEDIFSENHVREGIYIGNARKLLKLESGS